MKRVVITVMLLLGAARAGAQGIGDSLIVHLMSGERVAIALAEIRKITFDSVTASATQEKSYLHGLTVSPSYPNPTRASTNIELDIPTAGSVSVTIHDSKGSLVRELPLPNAQAGHNHLIWDGLDEHNTAAESGPYFYEVRFKGDVLTKKGELIR